MDITRVILDGMAVNFIMKYQTEEPKNKYTHASIKEHYGVHGIYYRIKNPYVQIIQFVLNTKAREVF